MRFAAGTRATGVPVFIVVVHQITPRTNTAVNTSPMRTIRTVLPPDEFCFSTEWTPSTEFSNSESGLGELEGTVDTINDY